MKTKASALLLLSLAAALSLSLNQDTSAQAQTSRAERTQNRRRPKKTDDTSKPAASAQKPLPADPKSDSRRCSPRRTFLAAGAQDGALGEERTGDKFQIASVTKGSDDNWTVNAKMKYRDQEIVMPIPVKMKFSGDTAILTVVNLMIPSGGTYTARLLIYERTYSGTWKSQRGGGMLDGTITNEAE
jgi:hypothetical protein